MFNQALPFLRSTDTEELDPKKKKTIIRRNVCFI
jgi:hypothetical protein